MHKNSVELIDVSFSEVSLSNRVTFRNKRLSKRSRKMSSSAKSYINYCFSK